MKRFLQTICALMVVGTVIVANAVAVAQTLATPTSDVVLTVSGKLAETGDADVMSFDMPMLEKLEETTIKTTTIWTEGVQTFSGVSLADLLQAVGVSEGTLLATAINDYTIEIPVTDAVKDGPIIAYALNGKAMSIRDKGPLWVIYPYDRDADYRSELIYSRSIWQLDRIEVVK